MEASNIIYNLTPHLPSFLPLGRGGCGEAVPADLDDGADTARPQGRAGRGGVGAQGVPVAPG